MSSTHVHNAKGVAPQFKQRIKRPNKECTSVSGAVDPERQVATARLRLVSGAGIVAARRVQRFLLLHVVAAPTLKAELQPRVVVA